LIEEQKPMIQQLDHFTGGYDLVSEELDATITPCVPGPIDAGVNRLRGHFLER
jgi:hypothetical protein